MHPVLLAFPIPFLLGASFMVPDLVVELGLMVSAITLGILAVMGILARRRVILRQRLLSEAVPLLVSNDLNPAFLTDVDGVIAYANDAANERFTETSDESLAARLATVIANPDAVLYRLQSRAITMASAREDIVTRAGQYRLSVARVGPMMFLWRFDDLAQASAKTERASATLSLPMMTVGKSGAILFLNDAFRRLLECRPRAVSDVFGPDPIRSGDLHRIKTTGGTVDCIVAEVSGGPGRREIYALPAPPTTIGPWTEKQVSTSWSVIEDLPVPLMKVSGKGDIIESNREARMLLGVQSTENRRMTEMLDGLGRPVDDWVKEIFENKEGQASQFLQGKGDRQDHVIQVTLNAVGVDSDAHLIAVLNDVTELKSLEAQFVQSQKMHAIGQLAGGVAHDFNNLLTAISGHCDLLLLRHDQGDQDYSDLLQIHQNANRAASLVGQLLAFSRKQNLQPEIVDLRDTLSDLTHLLNRLVGEKVTLTLNHDPNLSPIKADKRQLEQVLMNLVVNARDAMPDGGTIQVVTENLVLDREIERDRAFVPAGEYVVVKVNDEGKGIPPEIMSKIFVPFYTTKRLGEGTGLGLSTAYGIVKQTGGYIFADSEVGRGTQFSLLFPHHDAPIADVIQHEAPVPTPLTSTSDGVVLLVEDEAPVRAFASRALRLRGYTVIEAECAEAALQLLSDPDLNVDIFVTDVIMPGMDGPTWVREALCDRPDTKVVFVSGYAEDAFGDGKTKIPNSVFLPKPFSLNDLTNTVQGQLH
ncbi:two-component system cell cycle sensor histidine kinase/response regulator CckA [Loktanella ponticola]|uniref:histidine kinase n=2 Tax=Yoonia ponticola TaxID=1524255 RepID=A0A7W9BJC3_9RHOB|nr:ATP-binding protein [Yoonia ponticola]MBB5721623.1 two-component system cell cycle sensor histidine kinase/response regulator CckA [Yoonia ponticola]